MGITWAESADKHGVEHDDALHAIANAYYVRGSAKSGLGTLTCGFAVVRV